MKRLIDFSSRFRILKGGKISLVVSALLGGATLSFAAPSGGTVTSGSATISQNGAVTNITQATNKASINWQSFSIAQGETVNFNQPSAASITLNRVIGNERSVIDGALNANGQVWILNSNGVLFGKNASINTAGLLATTAKLSDEDFQAGNYNFTDATANSVINEGTITISDGGSVILASNEVKNSGTIQAVKGKVHLVGADSYSLNLNGNSLVNLKVDKGVLDAMVENSGTIIADGGEIYLTTNAVDELLRGVVNNTGIIEANSLNGLTGKVELFAHGGTAKVDGTIEAEGGFVETSAKDLSVKSTAQIKTAHWLIDPENITISSAGEDDIGGASISATTVQNALSTADVELQAGEDITVNEDITWESAQKLTLNAGASIFINSEITALNNDGQLALYYSQYTNDGISDDNYYINAPINLKAGDNFFTKKGSDGELITWKVITDLGSAGSTTGTDLQGINGNLSGNYVLGSNIDASETSSWNVGDHDYDSDTVDVAMGFDTLSFNGNFDGLGHTISHLYINRPKQMGVGLFMNYSNTSSIIKNLGIVNADVTGKDMVGILLGMSDTASVIDNVYTTGKVIGTASMREVGGLVGYNKGTIQNSFSTADVTGEGGMYVGGLVGYNGYEGTIQESFATGDIISSSQQVGGLVGLNQGSIENSFSLGTVTGTEYVGGFVGANSGTINTSYSTGAVLGSTAVGGFVGQNNGTGTIKDSYFDSQTSGFGSTQGVGSEYGSTTNLTAVYSSSGEADAFNQGKYSGFDFTNDWYIIEGSTRPLLRSMHTHYITNPYELQLMSMDLGADYVLANDIDLSGIKIQSDIWNSGNGWSPIGNNTTSFTGTFSGNNHVISNLYIMRSTTGYQGLFGKAQDATISSIKLQDAQITGASDIGSIVGYLTGESYLSDVMVLNTSVTGAGKVGGIVGTFNGTKMENLVFTGNLIGNMNVGGIAGTIGSGDIINVTSMGSLSTSNPSYSFGGIAGGVEVDSGFTYISNAFSSMLIDADGKDVNTGNDNVGGLVGYLGGNVGIEYSYFTGKINGDNSVGGLVGYIDHWGDAYETPYIKNSYSTVEVTGTTNVGGLIGYSNKGLLKNSYFTGTVTGVEKVGGLVGDVDPEASIEYSFYDKDINTAAMGDSELGKTTAELQSIATFTTDITDETKRWDITEDDTISSTYKYPVLVTKDGVTSWKIYSEPTPEPDPEVPDVEDPTPDPDPEVPDVEDPTPDPEVPDVEDPTPDPDPEVPDVEDPTPDPEVPDVEDPTPEPEPTPTPEPTTETPNVEEPTPETPQEKQVEKIKDIVTPIINGTRTAVNTPQVRVPQTATPAPRTQTVPNNLGLGNNARIVSTTTTGEQADQIVSLGELQQANGGAGEVRVPLSDNSIVDLVNGGVNLPNGVDQQFFVVSEEN